MPSSGGVLCTACGGSMEFDLSVFAQYNSKAIILFMRVLY